jgi:hypothetical protein
MRVRLRPRLRRRFHGNGRICIDVARAHDRADAIDMLIPGHCRRGVGIVLELTES